MVLASAGMVRATGATEDARKRAAFYQEEATKVLAGYHWAVVRNKPGSFIAVHNAYPGGAMFNGGASAYEAMSGNSGMTMVVFYATVNFRPVSAARTDCSAALVTYVKNPFAERKGGPKLLGPSPANSPAMTKYFEEKLASAEKRMLKNHPEFRAN